MLPRAGGQAEWSACICSPTRRSCWLCSPSENAAVVGPGSERSSGARGPFPFPGAPRAAASRVRPRLPTARAEHLRTSFRRRAPWLGPNPLALKWKQSFQRGSASGQPRPPIARGRRCRGGGGSPLQQARTARPGRLETPPRDELMLDARGPWARLSSAKATPRTGEGKCGQADTLKPTRKLESELLVAVFSVWGDLHTAA